LLSDGTTVPPIQVDDKCQVRLRDGGKCVLAPSKDLIDAISSRAYNVATNPISPCFPDSTEIECQPHYSQEYIDALEKQGQIQAQKMVDTIKEMEEREREEQINEWVAIGKLALLYAGVIWILTRRKKSV
jgi:hypothetical protein